MLGKVSAPEGPPEIGGGLGGWHPYLVQGALGFFPTHRAVLSSFSRLRWEPQTGLLAVPWQGCARRAVRAAGSLLSGSSAEYAKGKLHDSLEFSLLRNAS